MRDVLFFLSGPAIALAACAMIFVLARRDARRASE
jgi:hypothetical protein